LEFDLVKTSEHSESGEERIEIHIRNGEVDSKEIFQSQKEIRIRHQGGIYRLRLTSLNKLILTK
jgi:hemin uptake protein HemP